MSAVAKPCEGGKFTADSVLTGVCSICFRTEDDHAAQQALARGVRGERAAIVLFLRNNGFIAIADRVEHCEHAEEALRIASLPRVEYLIQKSADGSRAVQIRIDGVLEHACSHGPIEFTKT